MDTVHTPTDATAERERRAHALGVPPSLLVDFDDAKARLFRGEDLPAWADEFNVFDDYRTVHLDGAFGEVSLSAAIVFEPFAEMTSNGVNVLIDHVLVAEEVDAQYLRSLAASLISAATAVETKPRVLRRPRSVDERLSEVEN